MTPSSVFSYVYMSQSSHLTPQNGFDTMPLAKPDSHANSNAIENHDSDDTEMSITGLSLSGFVRDILTKSLEWTLYFGGASYSGS